MKNITTIFLFVFILIGCTEQSVNTAKISDSISSDEIPLPLQLDKEDLAVQTETAFYSDCLLSGECSPEYNNENIPVRIEGNQFKASSKNSAIEIEGQFSNSKTPFPEDERNWAESSQWITKLGIKFYNSDVFMPVLSYMDLSPPENIYFREQGGEKLLILQSGSNATLLRFTSIICDGVVSDEFEISERLDWYMPMYGDSFQNIKFKIPNCN